MVALIARDPDDGSGQNFVSILNGPVSGVQSTRSTSAQNDGPAVVTDPSPGAALALGLASLGGRVARRR
jgi:hypothetical protein